MPDPRPKPVALVANAAHFALVEDDTLLRELLRRAIGQRFAPKTLAVFADGRTALAHCQAAPVDILITDLALPDLDGRELIRRLRALRHAVRVIVLTGKGDMALPAELIALGVAGFVDKSAPIEQLEIAVERVLAGGMYFAADLAPSVAAGVASNGGRGDAVSAAVLSERERLIVRLVAQGRTSKEIGVTLGLNSRVVEKERAVVMEKIQVRELAGLVRWCLQHGLG